MRIKIKRLTTGGINKLKETTKKIIHDAKESCFDNSVTKPEYIDLNLKKFSVLSQRNYAALGPKTGKSLLYRPGYVDLRRFSQVRQKEFNKIANKIVNNKAALEQVVQGTRAHQLAADLVSKTNKAKAKVLGGIEEVTGLPSIGRKRRKAEELSKLENAALRVGRKSRKLKRIVAETGTNPGKTVRKASKKVVEHPLGVTVGAAGYATPAMGLGYIPGTNSAAIALEGLAQEVGPYRNATKSLGKKIGTGKLGDFIENASNVVIRTPSVVFG